MPAISADWKKVEMNNWSQYGFKVDSIRIHLNHGDTPSIEFIPSAVDGDDPYKLHATVLYDCTQVAKKLECSIELDDESFIYADVVSLKRLKLKIIMFLLSLIV
jgi:hypothetical protein